MKKMTIYGAVVFALFSAQAVSAEKLTNETVILLLESGLGEEVVIAKIEGSEGDFDTSVDELLRLSKKGASSSVIAAMVKQSSKAASKVVLSEDSPDPSVPHYTGVYIMNDTLNKMERIDPIASTQIKTGGFLGAALTYGIASASLKAVFPGAEARTSSNNKRPTFYFYFDASNPQVANATTSVFGSGYGVALQSPNEISLVKLKQKKGRREARVGSSNIGGFKGGIMDKDQVVFDYDRISNGVYKVTPKSDLKKGEYGYILITSGAGSVSSAKVFEFSIK